VQLRGSLDRVDSEFIEGWITCAEAPDLKVVLEVWLGGNLLGHAAADRFRADLAESDIGDGHCAFSFKLPSFIPDSQLNQIKLKLVNTDFLWLPEKLPGVAVATNGTAIATPSRFGGLWIDRPDWIDRLAEKVRAGEISDALSVGIFKFCRDGYYVIPGAVSETLVASLNEELDQAWKSPPPGLLVETFEPDGVMKYVTPDQAYRDGRTKLLDFYAHSALARKAIAAPRVIEFLSAIFDDKPKAFQGLYFQRGSPQAIHKDTAYVKVDTNPLALAATWLALEDVSPGTGELEYYIGSHRAPEFLFGGYSKWMEGFADEHDAFLQSLHDDARTLGHVKGSFLAKKGDVLVWHADLAHGDSRVTQPDRTRRSLVTHFTAAEEEPFYRRNSRHEQMEADGCIFVSQYGDVG
jgi:Phytanoyl-CoA dioxygenase (PhyH)